MSYKEKESDLVGKNNKVNDCNKNRAATHPGSFSLSRIECFRRTSIREYT